ncbi:MAG TPA: Na+/H+ antiporter subunit E [Bacteroidales bacterium]|nr:Na+/H+ antiporter subunit E [Bacteroidales bacterium]
MFVLLLVSVFWIALTYQYGLEAYLILFCFDALLLIVIKKIVAKSKFNFRKVLVLFFILSFFSSFFSAFKITFMMIFQKTFRGIYELVLEDMSNIDQFFLSTAITIVPNTIYLDRIGNALLIHKIASDEQEAHEPEKLYFL